MQCKICKNNSENIFKAKVLNKYVVNYFHCPNCGFLQTETPFWLDEAYRESINISDTGYVERNIIYSKKVTILLSLFFNKQGKYLDYAAGYGMFVRLMRDIGFDFYWQDKYTKNLFSSGFEYDNSLIYDAVTSFESFEHFVDPIEEIEQLLRLSKNIIFSTNLLPSSIPQPDDWWYYGLEHGQHISFFSINTLKYIAEKYNINLYSNKKNLHMFTDKKINSTLFYIITKFTFVRLFFGITKMRIVSKTQLDTNFFK